MIKVTKLVAIPLQAAIAAGYILSLIGIGVFVIAFAIVWIIQSKKDVARPNETPMQTFFFKIVTSIGAALFAVLIMFVLLAIVGELSGFHFM